MSNTHFDPADLDLYCQDPGSASAFLGTALAPYLLTEAARREAGVAPPLLSDRSGSCTALLVWRTASPKVLRPSFILPLTWHRDRKDSARLPRGLGPVADGVRRALDLPDWGLDLAPELDGVDLSGLAVDADSTWASLAAGLIVASEGGVPRSNVFATGSWTGRGIEAIDQLEAKIGAVRDWSEAHEREAKIFVPAANAIAALELKGGSVEVAYYPPADSEPKSSLKQHLADLEVPPSRETEHLDRRIAFFNRDRRPWKVHLDYYIDHLAKDIAVGLREDVSADPPVARLALAVGLRADLATLLIETLRPREALLLVTKDSHKYVERIKEATGRADLPVVLFDMQHYDAVVCELRDWLSAARSSGTDAVDITGGTGAMTACLLAAAWQTGSRVLYLTHNWEQGRNQAGEEMLVPLRLEARSR